MSRILKALLVTQPHSLFKELVSYNPLQYHTHQTIHPKRTKMNCHQVENLASRSSLTTTTTTNDYHRRRRSSSLLSPPSQGEREDENWESFLRFPTMRRRQPAPHSLPDRRPISNIRSTMSAIEAVLALLEDRDFDENESSG